MTSEMREAAGKAAYNAHLYDRPYAAWEDLPTGAQEHWRKVGEAACKAAQQARDTVVA